MKQLAGVASLHLGLLLLQFGGAFASQLLLLRSAGLRGDSFHTGGALQHQQSLKVTAEQSHRTHESVSTLALLGVTVAPVPAGAAPEVPATPLPTSPPVTAAPPVAPPQPVQGSAAEPLIDVADSLPDPAIRPSTLPLDQPQTPQLYFRPVSATVRCVITLAIVSLLLHTGLTASRNYDELSGRFAPSLRTEVLAAASRPTVLASMLSVLFVACRMLVLAVTQGLGEPAPWVKACMYTATAGLMLEMCEALLLPLLVDVTSCSEPLPELETTSSMGSNMSMAPTMTIRASSSRADEACRLVDDLRSSGSMFQWRSIQKVADTSDGHILVHQLDHTGPFTKAIDYALQALSKVAIYGGIGGVILAMSLYVKDGIRTSAAAPCTIILTVAFFVSFFALWLARSVSMPDDVQEVDDVPATVFVRAGRGMAGVGRKAPVLGVLFIISRMRALELNPASGVPSDFVQLSFYAISALFCLEMLLAGALAAAGTEDRLFNGMHLYESSNLVLEAARHAVGFAGIIALIPVAAGVADLRNEAGVAVPLSITSMCTSCLMAIYFSLMAAVHVLAIKQVLSGRPRSMLQETLLSACVSVSFAPQLCLLFLVTRIRALQISQQLGDPPAWAQDAMVVAVFATCVEAVCCLFLPIFSGSVCKVDDDGHPDYDLQPMIGAFTVNMVKWVALLSIHSCVVALSLAIFFMTPESVTVRGAHIVEEGPSLLRAVALALVILALSLLFSSAKVVGLCAKWALESCDRAILGVDITVSDVALGLCKGYVKLKDVVVHQPEDEMEFTRDADGVVSGVRTGRSTKWQYDYILKTRLLLVKVNLWRLLRTCGREVELTDLELSGVQINIEKLSAGSKAMDSNLDYILYVTPEMQLDAKELLAMSIAQTVVIHRFAFGNAQCRVTVRGVPVLGSIKFRPRLGIIRFESVQKQIFKGREDLTLKEAVTVLTREIMKRLAAAVLMQIPSAIRSRTSDATSSCTDPCKAALQCAPCLGGASV